MSCDLGATRLPTGDQAFEALEAELVAERVHAVPVKQRRRRCPDRRRPRELEKRAHLAKVVARTLHGEAFGRPSWWGPNDLDLAFPHDVDVVRCRALLEEDVSRR